MRRSPRSGSRPIASRQPRAIQSRSTAASGGRIGTSLMAPGLRAQDLVALLGVELDDVKRWEASPLPPPRAVWAVVAGEVLAAAGERVAPLALVRAARLPKACTRVEIEFRADGAA